MTEFPPIVSVCEYSADYEEKFILLMGVWKCETFSGVCYSFVVCTPCQSIFVQAKLTFMILLGVPKFQYSMSHQLHLISTLGFRLEPQLPCQPIRTHLEPSPQLINGTASLHQASLVCLLPLWHSEDL